MRNIINQLVQLQELILTRDEQRALPDGAAHLDRLNDDIDALSDTLPKDAQTVFARLYKRDHIIMAPMHNNMCPICGMSLATSQVQAVRRCETLQTCPSCARILYDPDGARWVAQRKRSATTQKLVGVARFSSEKLMVPRLAATTRDEAIAELAKTMQEGGFVDDAEKLTVAAIARESVVSTSLGRGTAFPHVRGIEGGGLAFAFGYSVNGIAFDADDKDPCHFIFLTTIPTAVSAFYLKLMAGLSESLRKENHRAALAAAETPEALWKALTKATRTTIK